MNELAPAWSPDGTRIAFVCIFHDREICVANVNDGKVTQLTNIGGNRSPTWSPDGSRIAFASYTQGIYVMNADGSGLTPIVRESFIDTWYDRVTWSPDGTRIAFEANHQRGIYNIFVTDVEGNKTILIPSTVGIVQDSAWSPDGKHIAYAQSGISVAEAEGNRVTKLIHGDWLTGYSHPAWSPDGTRIAFDSISNNIYVMNADGSHVLRLTEDSVSATSPAGSPDGKYIAFVSRGDFLVSCKQRIYIMTSDGTNRTLLTNQPTCQDATPV